jgi:hypothetical protein
VGGGARGRRPFPPWDFRGWAGRQAKTATLSTQPQNERKRRVRAHWRGPREGPPSSRARPSVRLSNAGPAGQATSQGHSSTVAALPAAGTKLQCLPGALPGSLASIGHAAGALRTWRAAVSPCLRERRFKRPIAPCSRHMLASCGPMSAASRTLIQRLPRPAPSPSPTRQTCAAPRASSPPAPNPSAPPGLTIPACVTSISQSTVRQPNPSTAGSVVVAVWQATT